jgi:hypothetical protein
MDKEKFKLRLDIKTGNEDTDLYLHELHNYLLNFEASSVKKMVMSLDNIAQKITEDLDNIIQGEDVVLTILVEDSKIFDKVQKIVEKIDSWKKVSEMAESLRPDIEKEKKYGGKPTLNIDSKANPFEQIQKTINQKK